MWMELESIMLSELSQSEKDKYRTISYVEFKKQNKGTKKKREKPKNRPSIKEQSDG